MTDDKKPLVNDEVEEMVAELEGREAKTAGSQTPAFPATFQARGQKTAPRWPSSFTAAGAKGAPPPPRWAARFIASGTKPAR